jgi:hypothetical protein
MGFDESKFFVSIIARGLPLFSTEFANFSSLAFHWLKDLQNDKATVKSLMRGISCILKSSATLQLCFASNVYKNMYVIV